MKTGAKTGGTWPQAKNAWGHPKLDNREQDPAPHLDFTLLSARTTTQCISVVVNRPVCGPLFQHPPDPNTDLCYPGSDRGGGKVDPVEMTRGWGVDSCWCW